MEKRGRGIDFAIYLTASVCCYEPVAAYCRALGAGQGISAAFVLLYGLPALGWFFRDRGGPREEIYRIEGGRPWVAFLVMGLFLIAIPLLSTHLALAGDGRNGLRVTALPLLDRIWLPVLLIGGFWFVFFWRKRSPKTVRRHLRGKQLHEAQEVATLSGKPDESDERALVWGGMALPREAARLHFAVVGVTGSGKTLTLRLLLQSVVARIGHVRDTRALVYDAKGDLHGLLSGMGAKTIHTLNPFDERCVAPDLAADFTSPACALQLASLLIPENPRASQPFFDNAARCLLTKVIISYLRTAPGAWDLRDVILATQSKAVLTEVLGRVPDSVSALVYLERQDTAHDILSTLASRLAPFEIIAAAWHQARRRLSLRQWLKEDSILVLGNDESLRTALQAVNRLLVQRLSELCLHQSESKTRETWLFLDEVREAGRFEGLGRLLTNGRSKGVCVCLGFQDIEGLREVYGERLANEMLGQCSNKAVLRLESASTATWAAGHFGQREVLEESTSAGANLAGMRRSISSSMSLAIRKTENVLPSEFLDIPPTNPANGLTGYYQTPYTGAFRCTLSGPWLAARLQEPDQRLPNQQHRREADQYLPPWTAADRERLCLRPRAGSKSESSRRIGSESAAGDMGILSRI